MTEYITPIVSGLPIVTCPDGAEGPIMGRDIPEGWEACAVGRTEWYPADRCNPALPYWTRPPQRDPWVGERVRVSREGFPVEGIVAWTHSGDVDGPEWCDHCGREWTGHGPDGDD